MKKSRFALAGAALLLVGVLDSVARAAEPVRFDFSNEASRQWVKLYYGIDVSAVCTVNVLRPGRYEDPLSSPDNLIKCQVEGEGSPRIQVFADAKLESWGDARGRSVELKGGVFVKAMLAKFRARTADLPDSQDGDSDDPDAAMWYRGGICDPNGSYCTQFYFLNETPDPETAGQAECNEESELIRPSSVYVDPDDYKYYAQYLAAMIAAQIAAGDRVIIKERCLFI